MESSQSNTKEKIFVTGANGFLGACVVHSLLVKGYKVLSGVRKNADLWRLKRNQKQKIKKIFIDLLEATTILEAIDITKPDIVIHCAAYGVNYNEQDARLGIGTNILGTYELITASAKNNVKRFIHIGSCFEYGHKDHPISEIEVLKPMSIYGSTKASGSILALENAETLGLPLVVLRPFGMWGPLEARHRLVPQIVHACLKKIPLKLTGGKQVRDYTFARDIAEAIVTVATGANFPAFEILNVGSGKPVLLKDFVLSIARELQGEELMQFDALPYRQGEMWQLVANVDKWKSLSLPPIAKTNLRAGIDQMVEEIEADYN